MQHHNAEDHTPQAKPAIESLETEAIARILNLTPAAIRRLFLKGAIPGRKVGKRWRTTRQALEAWLAGGK